MITLLPYQATAKTFLQYAIEKNRDGKLLEALMGGEHKVSMTRDYRGHTALSVAIGRTRKKAVRLLLQAVVEGRISRIPDSMGPILECFVPLVQTYPKLFLRFLREMPLEEEAPPRTVRSRAAQRFHHRRRPCQVGLPSSDPMSPSSLFLFAGAVAGRG